MPCNCAADSFHTKKICSRLSSSELHFLRKLAVFRLSDPFCGLRATYDDHLRLIGKRVVDFLLALIELFSLDVTAEALRAIIGSNRRFCSNKGQLTKNFRQKGSPPPTILLLRKLG